MGVLTETEIKLRLSASLTLELSALPVFAQRLVGHWQQVELTNQYFDTPDLALDRAGFALRLRRDGDQVIQTFKGRGDSLAGLSVRAEWDWYLQQELLEPERLLEFDLPSGVDARVLEQLTPLFRTDFTRTKGSLQWRRDGEPVEIEVALDRGDARTPERIEPFRELELELRQGPQEALLEFAMEVARELPVMPWDSAKAERGYRLVEAGRRPLPPVLRERVTELPVDDALTELCRYLLSLALTDSELLAMGDSRALAQVERTLDYLRVFSGLAIRLGEDFPPDSVDRIVRLQRALACLDLSVSQKSSAQAALALLERGCDWGLLTLSLSQWLLRWHQPGRAQKEQKKLQGVSLSAEEISLFESLRKECHGD
ncbi:inorganic triphosphatase [Marinobacterium sp. YM272]|uniref:CYTH domain-containing protein n=1 Tax=Marinobacterium sp. YM272 TaxID=3421654 RepID=UPI003D7FA005